MKFYFFLLCLFLSQSLFAQNWPEFRGAKGDGISTVKSAPITWHEKEQPKKEYVDNDSKKEDKQGSDKNLTSKKSLPIDPTRESENIAWKVRIPGKGWSSPVVWENQVWVTTAPDDGKKTHAVCVDLKTGKIEHNLKLWDVAKPQEKIAFNSYASCTPAIEKDRVYVHFGSHGTGAVDTKTGEIIWHRGPDDKELQCNHMRGPGSSVAIYKDLLLLTFDGGDRQFLIALNKLSGRTIWRTGRNFTYEPDPPDGDWRKAYSTPSILKIDGADQLVSASSGWIASYEPMTGKEIWRAKTGGMNAAARPIYENGLLYCSSFTEGILFYALKPEGTGDITDKILWKQSRGAPRRCGAIILGKQVYFMHDDGIVSCLDAMTGKVIWTERLGGEYAASPVYAAGRIYFFDIEGRGTVIEPGEKFKKVAINRLNNGCMGSPAVVEGALIVRTKDALYRIEQAKK